MNILNIVKLIALAIVFLIGVLLVFIAIFIRTEPPAVKKYFTQKLADNLALKENSSAVQFWITPPAYIFRKFYMFNVTNPADVLKGKKPVLQELGPYVYREVMEKRDFRHLDAMRVTYTPVSTLYFERTLSNGSEFDYINFLSLLDMGVAAKSDKLTPTVFINKTVNDLIAGYKSSLLDMVNLLTGKRKEKFGLYFEKNGTGLNTFVASTGVDNIYNVGKIESWNGLKQLDYWATNYSNAINGSDGSKYPPNIMPNQTLYFFNPDLCRSIRLEHYNNSVVGGVNTLNFRLPKDIFSNNETLNPDYKGFCPNNDCLGDGVQSIRECRDGLPMFVSMPHFLNADKNFLKNVSGLLPSEDKHNYNLRIEPLSGTTIKSNIRVQFNFHLKKNKKFKTMDKIKDVLLPLFWLDLQIDTFPLVKAKMIATHSKVDFVKIKLPIVALVIGSSLICFSLVFLIFLTVDKAEGDRRDAEDKKYALDKSKNRRFDN